VLAVSDFDFAKAVQLVYDPAVVSYERLCQLLFGRINPTLKDRVGNDVGTQYRHGVYTHSPAQRDAARGVFDVAAGQLSRPVVTELVPAAVFWPAEEYHQQYLLKGGQSAAKGAAETIRCYG
jgi:peptide-methionine (S)-S-oxide reductase